MFSGGVEGHLGVHLPVCPNRKPISFLFSAGTIHAYFVTWPDLTGYAICRHHVKPRKVGKFLDIQALDASKMIEDSMKKPPYK